MWRFLENQRPVDVVEHQIELTRFVREAALRRFGSARSAPMKPWISALTWGFLRLIAPVRRSFHAAFEVAKELEKQENCAGAKRMQVIGLGLQTKLKEFAAAVRWLVALDRHEFVERKAYDAQIAHDNNDARGCFAVVRALHGGKPRAHDFEEMWRKHAELRSEKREVARALGRGLSGHNRWL